MPCTEIDPDIFRCESFDDLYCDEFYNSLDETECVDIENPTCKLESEWINIDGRCLECDFDYIFDVFKGDCIKCSEYWDVKDCNTCDYESCLDCKLDG